MEENIIGRKTEYRRLDRCMKEKVAQLVVVYGRRRVGKTFLVNQYFNGRFDFKLTGAYEKPKDAQLHNFVVELNRHTGKDTPDPKSWVEAFELLRAYIENIGGEEKIVIFFDEMPWLDNAKSDFLSAFEWFWNDYGSANERLVFVVCGSATSWLVKNIDENKGGLFNRVTARIYLEAFSLYETELFLQSKDIEWSRYDIAECYMIMGGIPYYLNLLDNELSYTENIDNLFFKKRAELWDEFEHLYNTLFSNGEQYIKIVKALNEKRMGLTRKEICEKTKLPSNGVLTSILKNLNDSGFVRIYPYYGNKKREMLYQLSDYFTCFYFRFLKDNIGRDEHFWSNSYDTPAKRAWAGLTFEQLCKDHIRQIKASLGIEGVLSEESSWYSKKTDDEANGAQIDMLIDRRDHIINLCEMKFSINEYEIDKNYDAVLRNKLDSFRRETNTHKTLQLTMITTYGVKKNMYSGKITKNVVLDDLFRE